MGPKKPKKSKAEQEEEKLAREEEERKAKEREEKRQAEEAEKRRQEELRIAAEQKAFREKELARWQEEHIEISDEAQSHAQQLAAEERAEAEAIDWMAFKDPDGEPDATNEKDMNTFISLTREAQVQDMKEAVEWIKKIEQIATALEDVWANGLATSQLSTQTRAYEHLKLLKSMILEKVDQATLPLLRFYDKHVDDRVEINIEEVATQVSIGMWATFSDMRPPRKSVQLEKMGIKLDIPKPLLQQQEKFIYRFTRIPIVEYNLEAYDSERYKINPRSNNTVTNVDNVDNPDNVDINVANIPTKYVVGDLIYFDILFAPPPSFTIRARKWTLRDRSLHSMTIRKSEYPSSAQCRMYVKVPPGVVLSDDLRMAVWDEQAKEWSEEGISDYQYSESTRIVQFYITTVGILALVKKRNIDMPLKKWSLYPVLAKKINFFMQYTNDATIGYLSDDKMKSFRGLAPANVSGSLSYERHARLQISTQSFDLVIDIIGSQVCLIKPDHEVFSDLLLQPMSPGCLLKKLQRKGVNLLPAGIDLSPNQSKLAHVEDSVLMAIAQGASALDFSSSDWNQTLKKEQVGVLVRESSVYTCPEELNEFDCIFLEADEVSISYQNTPELGTVPGGLQYSLVVGNDYGRRTLYSTVLRPDEQVHMDMSRTLLSRITPEAMERVKRTNQRFKKTVQTLLLLIKLYSQS